MQKTICAKCKKELILHTDLPIPKKYLCSRCTEDFAGVVRVNKNVKSDKKK